MEKYLAVVPTNKLAFFHTFDKKTKLLLNHFLPILYSNVRFCPGGTYGNKWCYNRLLLNKSVLLITFFGEMAWCCCMLFFVSSSSLPYLQVVSPYTQGIERLKNTNLITKHNCNNKLLTK